MVILDGKQLMYFILQRGIICVLVSQWQMEEDIPLKKPSATIIRSKCAYGLFWTVISGLTLSLCADIVKIPDPSNNALYGRPAQGLPQQVLGAVEGYVYEANTYKLPLIQPFYKYHCQKNHQKTYAMYGWNLWQERCIRFS